jgi:hypothetical protein
MSDEIVEELQKDLDKENLAYINVSGVYHKNVQKYFNENATESVEHSNFTLKDALNKLFLLSTGSLFGMLTFFSASPENITGWSITATVLFAISVIMFSLHRAVDYLFTSSYSKKCIDDRNMVNGVINTKNINFDKAILEKNEEINDFCTTHTDAFKSYSETMFTKYNLWLEVLGFGSLGFWILGIIIAATHFSNIEPKYKFLGLNTGLIYIEQNNDFFACAPTLEDEDNCIKIPIKIMNNNIK